MGTHRPAFIASIEPAASETQAGNRRTLGKCPAAPFSTFLVRHSAAELRSNGNTLSIVNLSNPAHQRQSCALTIGRKRHVFSHRRPFASRASPTGACRHLPDPHRYSAASSRVFKLRFRIVLPFSVVKVTIRLVADRYAESVDAAEITSCQHVHTFATSTIATIRWPECS